MTENEAIKILSNLDEHITHTEDGKHQLWILGNESVKTAIKALKEVQQYRAIGTVEKCRKAMEKQEPKKPKEILRHRGGFEMQHCPNCDTDYQIDSKYTITDNYCPVCGKLLDSAFKNYCGNCGQAIAT